LQALAVERKLTTPPLAASPVLTIGAGCGPAPGTAALVLLDQQQWTSPEALLLDAIDRQLGRPDPERAARALRYLGPIERQLRGLLYQHAVPRYNDLKLSPSELVEHLQERLKAQRKP
jgi:hypothetical protein